jgi:hypothetical protein
MSKHNKKNAKKRGIQILAIVLAALMLSGAAVTIVSVLLM